MKRFSYPKVKLGFDQLFSLLSKGERYQNPEVVQKSNDILFFLSRSGKKQRDEKSAFVPIPYELCHPALANIPLS